MRLAKTASVSATCFGVSLLCSTIFASAARSSGALRTDGRAVHLEAVTLQLRRAVVVRQDNIFLSDLLAGPVSEPIRKLSEQLVIGSAPFPGCRRHISAAQIESAVDAYPEWDAPLKIVDGVDVVRWSRALTASEILSAMDGAIDGKNLRTDHPLSDLDVHFLSPVVVGVDLPRLKIDSIEADAREGVTHVRISVASEPKLHPFWVDVGGLIQEGTTVALVPIALGSPITSNMIRAEFRPAMYPIFAARKNRPLLSGGITRRAFHPGEAVSDDSLRPETLVRAGQLVQVVGISDGMSLTTTGTPLGAGHRGDRVRVRSADYGRIFLGTVVGPQKVEVRF